MPKAPQTVLFKLSGEALNSADPAVTIDPAVVDRFAAEIVAARQAGDLRVAIVVGGGNIWRGAGGIAQGMNGTDADHMGMLATVINALALKDALLRHGQDTRVMSAIPMPKVCEEWIAARALRHLEKGRVVICAAGLGEPHFTTDTAAVQRARQIKADILLKGTHGTVDGIYTADPKHDPAATKFDHLTFDEIYDRRLKVMDGTAFTHAHEAGLPIRVFNIMAAGNIAQALAGDDIGTLITA